MSKPTQRQIKFFEHLSLPAPSTKQACSSLIGYILRGNNKLDESVGDRVRRLRSYHRWVGARVKITTPRHKHHGLYGQIKSLRMRPSEEVAAIKERYRESPYPYTAVVALDLIGMQETHVPLSGLKVVCRAEQKLLFTP